MKSQRLCEKNEYCKRSFIVAEGMYFGLVKMHNAQEIKVT